MFHLITVAVLHIYPISPMRKSPLTKANKIHDELDDPGVQAEPDGDCWVATEERLRIRQSHQRSDSRRTEGDVLGAAQHEVDERTNERSV